MRKQSLLIVLLSLTLTTIISAQPGKNNQKKTVTALPPKPEAKKYPSLLWEISGNGLQKPSYLFGTMHVSDKLAFHLGDSFYTAIKSVDVVALETNPENWQDDFSKSIFYKNSNSFNNIGRYSFMENRMPNDLLRITSFAVDDYDEAMKASLAVEPSMINGMLYRTYGTRTDDFEEDTYLDLYIFQTGRKLGKLLTGVENFEESEKLVMEAYRDMMKDRNRKRKSYDFEGMYTNPKKVEDAYRKGDLDMLDSLEAMTVFSDAFQEKFLYKRNDIQANSIDSIIKKSRLFVAVGAAHLPGKRGVIEILRKKGYTLRPVIMDERNSMQKETIDKTRSNVVFTTQTSDDGFYQVDIPGKKFYHFTEWSGMDVVQYADMVNGAYYMVTRIKTNSLSWGHGTELIQKKIDSVLYENIPGKILKKTMITKNGYKGWEILNRTRRGDNQRYNVFITPFEIIVFKMSGNGEYISSGDEANKFFSSVKLKEYNDADWISYQPSTGGFTVQFPHNPSLLKDANYTSSRMEYAAYDKKDGNGYLVMKTSQHNYSFVEEDTFQLNLMAESYAFSPFIDKEVSHKFGKVNGYPALDCKYKHKDGSFSSVKYIIRGPVCYVVVARHKNDDSNVKRFLESFSITPFIYPEVKTRTDTLLHFTVQSPLALTNKEKDDELNSMMEMIKLFQSDDDDDDEDMPYNYRNLADGTKSLFVGNDTIGEKIFVVYNSPANYMHVKDTAELWKKSDLKNMFGDSTFIYKVNKKYQLPNGGWCREMQVTDTGSSRIILTKSIYRDGHQFHLMTLTDTISPRSSFLEKFFASFTPADTLKKESLFTRKTEQFFNDYFSEDSVTAKKARKYLYQVKFDSLDVPLLKNAIGRVNWNTKNYLEVKKYFISKIAGLKDSTVTPFLRDLYWKVKDSADLQNLILTSLLRQQTRESFAAFKDLIIQEPPISGDNSSYDRYSSVYIRSVIDYSPSSFRRNYLSGEYDPRFYGKWASLYDTLSLAKTIFPDMLQLINIDDYKDDVKNLLTVLVDSGYLKASDYESQFSKFYLDAKQSLKKQVAKEEKENIDKASNKDRLLKYGLDEDEIRQMDEGNDDLEQYAVLLMPFYEKNQGLPGFYEQLMKTKDRQLLYNTFILLLRNNKPVPDSLFTFYAKQDKYRVKLYDDLKKIKKLDKFPAAWKSQQEIAKSLFIGSGYRYSKPDTVVYLDKLPVTYKGKKGWVYFFKFRPMRDDTHWQVASVGMQPENTNEIDTENDDFTDKDDDRKLETDKPEKEQLQKIMKELLYSKRSSAEDFYNARSYNIYKTYLSEMVKRQRYRD